MREYKGHNIDKIGGGYVLHFLALEDTNWSVDGINAICAAYIRAQAKAKSFGGVKFHNKKYGGGIKFDDLEDLKAAIDSAEKETVLNS